MIVMANYLIAISGHKGTNWQIKGTALACYTLATLSKFQALMTITHLDLTISKLWYSTQSTHTGSRTASVLLRSVHYCSLSSLASLSWVAVPLSKVPRQTSVMLGQAAQQLLPTV